MSPAPISDISVIFDSTGDHTCDTEVARPMQVSYERRLKEVGTASFTLAEDDDQRPLLVRGVRVAMRLDQTGEVLYSGEIRGINRNVADDSEEAGMVYVYTVEDDLSSLDFSIIRPATNYPTGTLEALARRPTAPERHIGWMDPIYEEVMTSAYMVPRSPGRDGNTWVPAIEQFAQHVQLESPNGRLGHPQTFPDPSAMWIWSSAASGGNNPVGDSFFFYDMLIPADTKGLSFNMAGDNEYEVWFNGQFLAASTDNDSNSAFTDTTRVIIRKTDEELGLFGRIAVRVRNRQAEWGGNLGGFLMAIRILGSAGYYVHTDSDWLALDYPTVIPGVPTGSMIHGLYAEGIQRDLVAGEDSILSYSSLDFSRTVDTAGGPFPIHTDLAVPDGTSMLGLLRMVSGVADFAYVPQASLPRYRLWAAKGTVVVGGGVGVGSGDDRTADINIEKGVNALDIEVAETSSGGTPGAFANVIVYRWKSGIGEVKDDASVADVGRFEHFLSMGKAREEGEAREIASRKLGIMKSPNLTYTASMMFVDTMVPGIHFHPGDTVKLTYNGVSHEIIVAAVGGSVDDDGNLIPNVELGIPREVKEGAFDMWLERISKGTDFEGGSATLPEGAESMTVQNIDIEYQMLDGTPDDTESPKVESKIPFTVSFFDVRVKTAGTTRTELEFWVNGALASFLWLEPGQTYAYDWYNSATTYPAGSTYAIKVKKWGAGMKGPRGRIGIAEVV